MSSYLNLKKSQLITFLLALGCIIAVVIISVQIDANVAQNSRDTINSSVEKVSDSIEGELTSVIQNVIQLTLRESKNVLLIEAQSDANAAQYLESQWSALFAVYESVAQIRFIDIAGNEVFRANRVAGKKQWVDADKLQNKSDRYYVIEAMSINNGVYISHIDLNEENGEVEQPYVPTIRIAAQYKRNGILEGIVIANVDLTAAFVSLEKTQSDSRHWLFNKDGFLLSSPDGNAWGWQLEVPNAKAQNLFGDSASAWQGDQALQLDVNVNEQFEVRKIDLYDTSNVDVSSVAPQRWLVLEKPRQQIIYARTLRYIIIGLAMILIISIVIVARKLIHAYESMEKETYKAIKAEQSKSNFLARMSHEIRTPMNGVYGLLQNSKGERDHKKLNKNIDQAISSFMLLRRIIDDVLDYSKIEANHIDIINKPFRLDKLLHQIGQLAGREAYGKGIDFWIDIDPLCPKFVAGDEVRINQVLSNLLSNAIKFTKKGEVIIRLEVQRCDEQEVTVVFSVSDTGIGMTQEELTQVFKAFTQASSETTRAYGGTGLGLSIAKQLVELMGGKIYADSTKGEGSLFSFDITLDIEEAKPIGERKGIHSLHMVLLSDNKTVEAVFRKQCNNLAWSVESVSTVEELKQIEFTENQAIHLVVDQSVLNQRSIHALEKWQLAHAEIKTVLISHLKERADDRASKVRVDSVLLKPFTPSSLFDAVCAYQAPTANILEPEVSSSKLAGVQILITEDNAINQQIAGAMIESEGGIVKFAENGEECLDVLQHDTDIPDLILMDIMMPIMDGLTAAKEIRKHAKWDSIPILALTANAMDEDKTACTDAGMQGHIAKPVTKNIMIDEIAAQVKQNNLDHVT